MNTQSFLRSTLALLAFTGACAVDATTDPSEVGTDGKADGGSSARLGARPTTDGAEFRVWAPNADRVVLTGTFTNSDWKGYDSDFPGTPNNDTTAVGGAKDGLGYHATIGIGAYCAVILSQRARHSERI